MFDNRTTWSCQLASQLLLLMLVMSGVGKSVVATDVLWSDPSSQPGLVENEARGVGLLFGPDITQVPLRPPRPIAMVPVWITWLLHVIQAGSNTGLQGSWLC